MTGTIYRLASLPQIDQYLQLTENGCWQQKNFFVLYPYSVYILWSGVMAGEFVAFDDTLSKIKIIELIGFSLKSFTFY